MDFSDLSTKTQRALERIPARHREDAAQEARLAELEGKSPGPAIKDYWRRERRYEEGQGSVAEAECPSVKVDHRNRKSAKCWRATQCEIERETGEEKEPEIEAIEEHSRSLRLLAAFATQLLQKIVQLGLETAALLKALLHALDRLVELTAVVVCHGDVAQVHLVGESPLADMVDETLKAVANELGEPRIGIQGLETDIAHKIGGDGSAPGDAPA